MKLVQLAFKAIDLNLMLSEDSLELLIRSFQLFLFPFADFIDLFPPLLIFLLKLALPGLQTL